MDKLDITMNIRLTKDDKELIVKYCNEHNLIISRFVRSAIMNTIKNNIEKENNSSTKNKIYERTL